MSSPKHPANTQLWSVADQHRVAAPTATTFKARFAPIPAKRSNGAYSPVRDSQKMSESAASVSPGPSTLDDPGKKDFQRSFKACDGCRTKKVKCELGDLAAPSEPPCARCKREMRPCQFTMSTRGRGPKARSSRSQAFGAHHLAKNPRTSAALEDDVDAYGGSMPAINNLAGAALATLPDSNPRLHSARNDVPVSALDPTDAPSIGMIYGLNRQNTESHQASQQQSAGSHRQSPAQHHVPIQRKRRRMSSSEPSDYSSGSDDRSPPEHDFDHSRSGTLDRVANRSTSPRHHAHADAANHAARHDSLQQYAEVGLQHSKDALRVLAGVAVDSRDHSDDHDASRDSVDREVPSSDANTVPAEASYPSAHTAANNGGILHPSQRTSSSNRKSASALQSRPITPPPLRHNYGWSKFEPVRLKLIKRSEARYFLNFFVRQMHSFAPHCSPHLLDKSPEALSELVCREPILLGAMLSVASRYAVVNNNVHVTAVDTFHRKISKWTQEKISRSFFLPASHTIGTIEALLILSEWATLDLHDRRASPDASSESEDEEHENNDADDASDGLDDDLQSTTSPAAAPGDDLRSEHEGQIPRAGVSRTQPRLKQSRKPRQGDMRESEKFDDTAWMLTGTALRLAERLDLHNDATYSGISSRNVASRRNAERRMRVWMSIVHADCHLSVRLGRRISSPGLAAPFTNLVRDRTHPFLLNSDMSTTAGQAGSGFPSGSNRAWIAFRAHSELLQIVFRTCENLYRSKAVTERLLEDEDFVPALKSIRHDLDNWANWTQPRIEPTRDMTSLRVRVEYHYARLYANGIALDSVKRSLTTLRNHRQYRASEAAEIGSHGRLGKSAVASGAPSYTVSFSTHPAYPFVREALAAAQSLIRILTIELESMMCAPARWFLLLVMAAIFCVKATAVSDSILPLKRCAQSLQQVITALEKAAPDGVHLANRYSMYLRQLAKQLVLTDAKSRDADRTQSARSKPRTSSHREGGSSRFADDARDLASGPAAFPVTSTQFSGTAPGSEAIITSPDSAAAQQVGVPTPESAVWPNVASMQAQPNSGWWSTADILPGEVDPQLFLKWLDDQTLATAPPVSHHPLSSWAHHHSNTTQIKSSRLTVAPPSQAGTDQSPSTDAGTTMQPQHQQPLAASHHYAPANLGMANHQMHGATSQSQSRNLGTGQEDLLTKMWLDDALTDLAAAGLDMPFL